MKPPPLNHKFHPGTCCGTPCSALLALPQREADDGEGNSAMVVDTTGGQIGSVSYYDSPRELYGFVFV